MAEKNSNLDSNFLEMRVATYKAVVGLVPCIGPFLSEFVGAVIPEQRVDRLVKYTKILDEKIQSISHNLLEVAKSNEEIIDLIEEGFIQSARAITNERREYIANVVCNGIADSLKNVEDSKYILKLLSELNDQEIIWLRFYLYPGIDIDNEFRLKHQNILQPISREIGINETSIQKAAIQDSYKNHLERLNLIYLNFQIDKVSKQPKLDTKGKPKVAYISLTPLGKLVLKQIGLFEN